MAGRHHKHHVEIYDSVTYDHAAYSLVSLCSGCRQPTLLTNSIEVSFYGHLIHGAPFLSPIRWTTGTATSHVRGSIYGAQEMTIDLGKYWSKWRGTCTVSHNGPGGIKWAYD